MNFRAIGLASLRRLKKQIEKKIFVKNLLSLIKNTISSLAKFQIFITDMPHFIYLCHMKKKVLKLSKEKFANGTIEGIPLGINYGCVVSTWDWAKKYLRNKFISKTLSKKKHLFSFVS